MLKTLRPLAVVLTVFSSSTSFSYAEWIYPGNAVVGMAEKAQYQVLRNVDPASTPARVVHNPFVLPRSPRDRAIPYIPNVVPNTPNSLPYIPNVVQPVPNAVAHNPHSIQRTPMFVRAQQTVQGAPPTENFLYVNTSLNSFGFSLRACIPDALTKKLDRARNCSLKRVDNTKQLVHRTW